MGYALNLCKFYIYHVPYNHNATEEGMEMIQNRIRIVDVADTLGLSSMASKESNPSLTTIHQEANLRAKTAIECLEAMRDGTEYKPQIVLPVDLRQYRIIPALRLKHRSGSCGTASALPKCSIRHPVLSALLA